MTPADYGRITSLNAELRSALKTYQTSHELSALNEQIAQISNKYGSYSIAALWEAILWSCLVDGDYTTAVRIARERPQCLRDLIAAHPLQRCIEHLGDRDDVVRFLLTNGEKVDEPTATWCWRPLHLAISRGCLKTARVLLEFHADPNRGNGMADDDTPLSLAIWCRSYEIVELLIHYGADPTMRSTVHGRSAIDEAVRCGWHDVVPLLRGRGVSKSRPRWNPQFSDGVNGLAGDD